MKSYHWLEWKQQPSLSVLAASSPLRIFSGKGRMYEWQTSEYTTPKRLQVRMRKFLLFFDWSYFSRPLVWVYPWWKGAKTIGSAPQTPGRVSWRLWPFFTRKGDTELDARFCNSVVDINGRVLLTSLLCSFINFHPTYAGKLEIFILLVSQVYSRAPVSGWLNTQRLLFLMTCLSMHL